MNEDQRRPDENSGPAGEDVVAADMRAVLATVVAQAPEPPSVATITARIDRLGSRPTAPGPAPSDGDTEGSTGGDLPLYAGGGHPHGGLRRDRAWLRTALIAAALIAVVAIGAVAIGGRDDTPETDVAEQPDPGGRAVVVPGEAPTDHWIAWVASGTSDEGDRYAAVHYDAPATGTLKVESVEVDPSEVDLVADARRSGSLEQWGDREVVVDADGRTAQFVDPAGVQVLVQGDPAVVREVVPTLQVLDGSGWQGFVADVGAEVEALPAIASYELVPDDLAEGRLTLPEAAAVETVRVSIHSDPFGLGDVKAGTCLTVDDATACRPGSPPDLDEPAGLETALDVLIDGEWWHFGWSTEELTGVTVTPDQGLDGPAGVRWAHGIPGRESSLSWWVSVLPAETDQIEVELSYVDSGSGFHQLRPAD